MWLFTQVAGKVQNVGFRNMTASVATDTGIKSGYTRKLKNGSVEVLAQGTREQLALFHAQLLAYPLAEVVSSVIVIKELLEQVWPYDHSLFRAYSIDKKFAIIRDSSLPEKLIETQNHGGTSET